MLYAILTGLVLRQHSTLQLNHPEECTAASSSFLTWALAGSTCIYIRLKSEAFFRLQCSMSTAYYWLSTNMHMWDPSPSSGCSELNLSRSKGANFEGTNLEILTAPVSKNNFRMFFHLKPFDTRPKAADSWGKSISGLKMCPIASSCDVGSKEASGWPLISGTLDFSTLSFLLSIHDRTGRWQTWIDIKLLTFKVEPAQLVDLRWDRFFFSHFPFPAPPFVSVVFTYYIDLYCLIVCILSRSEKIIKKTSLRLKTSRWSDSWFTASEQLKKDGKGMS